MCAHVADVVVALMAGVGVRKVVLEVVGKGGGRNGWLSCGIVVVESTVLN